MKLIMPNMKQANKILRVMKDAIYVLPGKDLFVDSYHNGREHGYIVYTNYVKSKAIVFSEFRSSDALVLYKGSYTEVRGNSSGISNRMYDAKEFFKYNDYVGVASEGLSYLLGRPR